VRLKSRTRNAVLAGLSSVAAAAVFAAPAPAAATKKARNVSCRLALFAVIKQPAPTAANFGSARCGRPFGRGVQQDSSTVKRSSLTSGTFTGPFKIFFDRGTIRGTFAISFVTTFAPGTYAITGVTYKGTLKVTRGTGSYRRVRGSGTITGFSPDAVTTQLVEKLKLTGIN
jgi:hypothetical protein